MIIIPFSFQFEIVFTILALVMLLEEIENNFLKEIIVKVLSLIFSLIAFGFYLTPFYLIENAGSISMQIIAFPQLIVQVLFAFHFGLMVICGLHLIIEQLITVFKRFLTK